MAPRFEPHRFRSTVPYYLRYRPAYPPELIDLVAGRCAIGPGVRLLDLGCGPGPLAVAFARLGATVVAVDPEPDMLAATRQLAGEQGVAIETVEGSSYDLGPGLVSFRAVTMGRSFHWMDRAATLAALDRMIEPDGAVVLFGSRHIEAKRPAWRELVTQLCEAFVPEGMEERRRRKASQEPQELVLRHSAFSRVERHGIVVSRTLTTDDVVGVTYSSSKSAPQALGDRQAAFEQALREGLARLSESGAFSETIEAYAMIARRALREATA